MEPIPNTFKDAINNRVCIANSNERKIISKSFIALSISLAIMAVTSNTHAAYVEQGIIGSKTSWESEEYLADWGLKAMNASSAYALGFNGQGAKVGVMDSGALLYYHSDLSGDRFHAVTAKGVYGSSGIRYPQATNGEYAPYQEGEEFDIPGEFVLGLNDNHGTHVTGTVGANRDGEGMHGVAWGSDIYVANNGGTDSNSYGPFQDYNYFYSGWKALVDAGVEVINNSWGTNIRIVDNGSTGADGGNTGVHIPANTIAQSEYEYFYFRKVYGDNPSFIQAAYDAVKDTSVVQIFTTGNRDMANPFYRALYPYFNPETEKHWIAVGGLQRLAGTDNYTLSSTWNEAGEAKWWTVVAPGNGIYSTRVNVNTGEPNGWGNSSGTSMSAPHVAGALGVLLSRYQDMNGLQVRDVMFTTANRYNPDGTLLPDWTSDDGVPDVRYGWGIPDLDKSMYGPGQFLGKFEYNMATTALDVWSNDITQQGLDARKQEDLAWLEDYRTNGIDAGGNFDLGHDIVVVDGNDDLTDHFIDPADAEKWRTEYYAKRAAAIQEKLDAGLYDGSLVKQGAGTLIMTGSNDYRGGTTVEGGALYGFTESFGTEKVVVNGGLFGIISSYNDTFTMQGQLISSNALRALGNQANIEVNAGGTYVISAGENVSVDQLVFNEGAMLSVGSLDRDVFNDAYQNGTISTGSVTASVLDASKAEVAPPDYAFFKTDVTVSNNVLSASFGRNDDVTFASYASNHNGRSIANVIENTAKGAVYDALLPATKEDVRNTFNSLSNDMYLNAQNASIINSMTLSRAIKDQAIGLGGGRSANLADGTGRLWMAGIGTWSDVDYGHSSMDVDFYAGLVGAEIDVMDHTKVGLYFGTGSTKFKGGKYGKIDSDDLHFGLYGVSNIADVASMTYGVMHTHQDRDASRSLVVGNQIGVNSVKTDVDITQVFAETAYTELNTDTYSVEPYLGFSWMRIKSDNYSETVNNMTFATHVDDQDIQVTTYGVRAALPFNVSDVRMAVKGDVYGMHFTGDRTSEANMRLANSGTAKIKGGKLSDMIGVGVGIDAQLSKSTTLGLSYTGTFDGDVNSNGIYAQLTVGF